MKRFSVLWTGAVAALLLAGSVQAAPVPWNYNWEPSTLKVVSDTSPTSFLTLTDEPGRTVNTDHTDTVATAIKVTSDAPVGFPDQFTTHPKSDVGFKLTIKDMMSGLSHAFVFTGTFATQNPLDPSTVSADSANVKFTPTGIQNVTQQIGMNEYNIKFVSYTPPGPPGSGNSSSIAYHVEVRQLDIQKSPEPSTMLLGGFGASFLGLGAWRKRRRQAGLLAQA
jgi:hypothetical protein